MARENNDLNDRIYNNIAGENLNDRRIIIAQNTVRIKQPRVFKISDDFELYLKRFEAYCFSNKIPNKDKAGILFSLFDDQCFTIVTKLKFRHPERFDEVCDIIKERFNAIEGLYGNKIKLRHRKRQSHETVTEFLEILGDLADKAGYNEDTKSTPIIESFITNVFDQDMVECAIKVQMKSEKERRDDKLTLEELTDKVKDLEKNKAVLKLHELKTSKAFLNIADQCTCEASRASQYNKSRNFYQSNDSPQNKFDRQEHQNRFYPKQNQNFSNYNQKFNYNHVNRNKPFDKYNVPNTPNYYYNYRNNYNHKLNN